MFEQLHSVVHHARGVQDRAGRKRAVHLTAQIVGQGAVAGLAQRRGDLRFPIGGVAGEGVEEDKADPICCARGPKRIIERILGTEFEACHEFRSPPCFDLSVVI